MLTAPAACRSTARNTCCPACSARISAIVAAGSGSIAASDAEALRAAFAVLLARLLRQQLADLAAGETPGSLVDTDALTRAERAELRAALRAVRSYAKGVFAEFSRAVSAYGRLAGAPFEEAARRLRMADHAG